MQALVFNHQVSIYLLVVEHDVRQPDVLAGHVEELDPAVVLRVPGELVVSPLLLHPHVGRQDLPPHVLGSVDIVDILDSVDSEDIMDIVDLILFR